MKKLTSEEMSEINKSKSLWLIFCVVVTLIITITLDYNVFSKLVSSGLEGARYLLFLVEFLLAVTIEFNHDE